METQRRSTGVFVVASPFLQSLTDELAARLSEPVLDPFASEIVVVPNIGVRDWLQRELCTRLGNGTAGIVANIRFMFVQQFLDAVFEACDAPSTEKWGIEQLTWSVHRAIDVIGRDSVPGASAKPLTAARAIADLFDRYSVHRPSMLRYWGGGRAVDGVEPLQELPLHLEWQRRLFQHLARVVGEDSPADRLAGLADRIRDRGLSELLPDKVTLFGFVTVNATMRTVIEAVGIVRDVHVYLVHPSASGPIPRCDGDRLVPRDHVASNRAGNPMLIRWGRPAVETSQVLGGRWRRLDPPTSTHSTCLRRIQSAITDDRPLVLAPIEEHGGSLDVGDGSIQVHGCHGRVRQVEVLRDSLLHLLEDDPTLKLSDISIQCADLDAFAPVIAAIFGSGRAAGTSAMPPLDVSIADRVLAGDDPYHDAFWSLLDLARSRCGVGETLTVLASAPVRRRFDVDDEGLARCMDWFDALSVKFGLDGEHRRKWGMPASIATGTWDAALDRLFMGLAVPADTPFEGPGGVVPFDDVSVTDAPLLARIADFLTRVRRLCARIESPRTVEEWAEVFASVIEDFFDETDTSDFACRNLFGAFDRMLDAAAAADVASSDLFSFDEVSAIVADFVALSGARPRLRTGAITVTELLPQQGVPYRVIALLGVSETMFSAGGVRGDDVLSLRPCIGDPMPNAAGRLQLLNVVLSAQDALVITCDAADINNNKPIPLPVPIQELLEVTAAVLSEEDGGEPEPTTEANHVRVLTLHPRQGFAQGALEPGLSRSDRSFTFDPVALAVNDRLSLPPQPVMSGRLASRSAVRHPARITARQMHKAVAKPSEFFVQDVLAMRLPSSGSGSGSDFVDFLPSNLEYSRAGRELLDGILRSPRDPHEVAEEFVRHMALSGVFPPGRLGEAASNEIKSEVLSLVHLVPDEMRSFPGRTSVELDDIELDASLPTVVAGAVDDVVGAELLRVSFTKYRRDLLLAPWIDLALATCADRQQPWSVRFISRDGKGEALGRTIRLVGIDARERGESALRVMSTVSTLMACMRRGRVPYLPRTSEAIFRTSLEAARKEYLQDAAYSTETQFLFGRVSWDDFAAEEALEDDPPGIASKRASRFAHFVWRSFMETAVVSTIEEEVR